MRRASLAMPARAFEVLAVSSNPSGRVFASSPWLIQTSSVRGLGDDVDLGVAVLARGSRFDLAAEVMHDELQTVADAEDGHAHGQKGGIGSGRVGVIDRTGAAGEDQAERRERANLVEGRGAGQDYREDIELADAAR